MTIGIGARIMRVFFKKGIPEMQNENCVNVRNLFIFLVFAFYVEMNISEIKNDRIY